MNAVRHRASVAFALAGPCTFCRGAGAPGCDPTIRDKVVIERPATEGVRTAARNLEGGTMSSKNKKSTLPDVEVVAGNGLLHRRALLGRGIVLAGAMTTGTAGALTAAAAEPLKDDPWSTGPGAVTPALQERSRF